MEAGDIYASVGFYDSAATFYRDILNIETTDYYQKANIAEAFIRINYLAEASDLIAELEQVTSKNNIVAYLKTRLLLAEGQGLRAKEYYSRAVAKNRITPAQHLYVAEVKWETKDIQGTIMALEHADQTAESESYHLGLRNEISLKKPELFLSYGDWRSADGVLTALQPVLTLDFKTIYLNTYVNILGGKKELAYESLTRLEILLEDNPYRLVKLGDLFRTADSLENADYYYNQALISDKINIKAVLGKVAILKSQKRFKEAIGFLKDQNQLIIYNRLIYPELVSLYRETGDLKKARGFINSVISKAPADIDRYRLAIELAIEAGAPEDTESIVKKCLENNPENGYALLMAGEQYMDGGSTVEAESYFQQAVPTNILSHQVYYRLGLLLEDKGEIEAAVTYYEKSVESNQYFAAPYGRMAAIMIERENIDKKLLARLMNYVRLSQRGGKNPDDFITLGRAQIIQTRYKAANNNFSKALKIEPNNPEYIYYAGMNYINLDSLKKARTYLNKAIKNGLSGELKSKAQSALGRL